MASSLKGLILIAFAIIGVVQCQDRPTIGFISPDIVADIGKSTDFFKVVGLI